MTAAIADDSQKTYARLAGVMYFFTVFDITGVIVLSSISGNGSFLNTAHSIAAWETLYRIGLILGLIGTMSTILLAIGLYLTLKPVSLGLAMTALLFRLAESTIGGVVVALSFVVLQINLEANHTAAFSATQLAALADLVSRAAGVGTNVSVVFFSVGSTIFFYLFLKSAYIPRALAMWGFIGSLLCLAAFAGNLVLPQSSEWLMGLGGVPIGIAEPALGLWLLVRGINTHQQISLTARSGV